MVVYLLLISLFIGSLLLSYRSLISSLDSIKQGTIQNSVNHTRKSQLYHQVAQALYPVTQPLLLLAGSQYHTQVNNLFVLENYLQEVVINTQQAYVLADKLYLGFVQKETAVGLKDQVLGIKTSLSQIYSHLQQLDLLLKIGDLPSQVLDRVKSHPLYSQIGLLQSQIIQAENLLDVLGSLETGETESHVLVLVQDQDELRGSGGALRYLLHLTFSQNHLSNTTVYSQKQLDDLNAGSLKAPDTVRTLTGSDYWKLKDMSYSADFSQTANNISWYFEKLTQKKPSLVISINKSFYEKLLSLDVQNQQIKTAPSSSLKTGVGESFNESLVEVINHYLTQYQNQNQKLPTFVQVLAAEIGLGNLHLYSSDPDTQNALTTQDFSGIPINHQCPSALSQSPVCFSQTTYLNESNFMAAPINHLISRQVLHQVSLLPDKIAHEYQIKYHFLADLGVLNRDYRSFYQLYLPSDATLSAVLLNGQSLSPSLWQLSQENSFNLYTFSLDLSVTQDHELRLQFSSPTTLPADLSQLAYSLTEIRQSGLNDTGYGLILNLPSNTHAKLVTDPVETKPQQAIYRYPTQTHTFGAALGYDR